MSEIPLPFPELLDRARQGDEQAMTRLARQYEPELRVFASVQLGPALRPYLDSIDLVQSVHRCLLAGLRGNKFDISSPEKLLGLAVVMVRRKVARHWRQLRRQSRLDGKQFDQSPVPQLLASLSSSEVDPASAASLRDAVEHLWRHLTESERQVIELRLEGRSTAEVARELGLDADVLRVRLSRLRQRLQAGGVLTEWL
jgi:RNA polymerase sigma factor (sigma-70 family)